MKKYFVTSLKAGISGFLIYTLIKTLKWNFISTLLANTDWHYVLAIIPLSLLGQVICALKWWYISRAFLSESNPFTFIELYFIGSFINRFLPSTVVGDIGRAKLLSGKENISFSQSTITVLIERATGFTALLCTAYVGLMIYLSETFNATITLPITAVCLGVTLLFIFSFNTIFDKIVKLPFLNRFSNLFNQIVKYRKNIKILVISLFISFLFYLVEIIIHGFLFLQFNISIPFLKLLEILPFVYLVANIPVAISGLGLRENSYIFFFGFIGISSEISLSVALIIFFYIIVQGLIGGLLLIKNILLEKKNKETHPVSSVLSAIRYLALSVKTGAVPGKQKEQLG